VTEILEEKGVKLSEIGKSRYGCCRSLRLLLVTGFQLLIFPTNYC